MFVFLFEQELVRSLRVEVWPGYITSIRQHEQDILMCAEISHKIMRSETVYDIIVRVRNESREDFRKALEKTLLGTTVLTDYNNKTYRIDDIRYDLCPTDTFPTKDGEISYVDYYKVSKNTQTHTRIDSIPFNILRNTIKQSKT